MCSIVRRRSCQISGSGKPLRFEHWGAHEDLSLPSSLSQRSQGLAQRTQRTRDTRVYTGSDHRCGVIPYSSVVWWIASWAEDEQLQGKNSLLRRGALVLGELVCVSGPNDPFDPSPSPTMVASPIYRGPGPVPKCRREGIQQRPNSKGDNQYKLS